MKKTTKVLTILLLIMMMAPSLMAIGFGHHIFAMKTTPEFSNGVYPTSLLYQFNFPIPDFIYGSTTEFALRLDNGIDFRKIKQDPITGNYMDDNIPAFTYPRDYMTFFDDFCFVFKQGFLHMPFPDEDLITANLTLGGRFEKSYERITFMDSPQEMEGLFYTKLETPRFDSSVSWIGAPELKGNRDTFQYNISIGLDINYMQDKRTRKNGIRNALWVRFNPEAMQQPDGNNLDFILLSNKLDIAYTLFSLNQNGERDTTWLSIVFENNTHYRFLSGKAVPYYAQNNGIWNAYALNTEHYISNRTSLTLYGPQILSYDIYPSISGFFDVGYSFGNSMNTAVEKTEVTDLIMSTGLIIDFNFFDIGRMFFEYGFIIDNTLDLPSTTAMNFGFSLGI